MAVEQLFDLRDGLVVRLLRLIADARCGAFLDVIFEARLVLARRDRFGRQVQRAGTELEDRLDRFQRPLHVFDVGVGSEIFGAIFFDTPGGEDARKALVLDTDVGIGLVVLEVDVVARLELFDEVVFQDQRFGLGVGDDHFDVGDFADQDLQASVLRAALLEVGAHTVAQVFGLAHVKHRALGVFVLIDAGTGG